MRRSYPMLTEIEFLRQFIIDTVDILEGEESLFGEHGFELEDATVKEYLFNTTADIVDLDELDDLVLDIADVLADAGQNVTFFDKGYHIEDSRG